MSKKSKTLLTLGGIATAVIGTVLAIKGYRSHQISKGLEKKIKLLELEYSEYFVKNKICAWV